MVYGWVMIYSCEFLNLQVREFRITLYAKVPSNVNCQMTIVTMLSPAQSAVNTGTHINSVMHI